MNRYLAIVLLLATSAFGKTTEEKWTSKYYAEKAQLRQTSARLNKELDKANAKFIAVMEKMSAECRSNLAGGLLTKASDDSIACSVPAPAPAPKAAAPAAPAKPAATE